MPRHEPEEVAYGGEMLLRVATRRYFYCSPSHYFPHVTWRDTRRLQAALLAPGQKLLHGVKVGGARLGLGISP